MRKIIFLHQHGYDEHNCDKEVFEFEDDATDKEIQEEFEMWVWEIIGDSVSWREEESEGVNT